ncbi:GBF-interacting protein 1-like isoform X1 [Cryptomeria japonica]|uniref:GBF-interacting protein 1-like isoform X1 n=1 Tax=Cryptomeria japonica TaxID=3369 RepID=UPI0027DAA998|nr:GBF-interacting protein 1-like isoform X1 [Cryptomeria japonica]
MKGGGIRPEVRKIIEGIKEIVKGYSDDDIHAMLQECKMDPDETAQKLLAQDPFHEVRRKRDKKKELVQNTSIPNSADARSRSGNQIRGARGGLSIGRGASRGSYRPVLNDSEGGKISSARENGTYNFINKTANPAVVSYGNQNVQAKASASGANSVPISVNGTPTGVDGSLLGIISPSISKEDQRAALGHTTMADVVKVSSMSQLSTQPEIMQVAPTLPVQGLQTPKFQQPIALTPISASGVGNSSPDPVYVPSHDVRAPGVVGTIKRTVGTVGAQRVANAQPTISPPAHISEPLLSNQSSNDDTSNSDVKSSGNNKLNSAVVNPSPSDHHASKSLTSDGDRIFQPRSQAGSSVAPGATASNPVNLGKQYSNRPQQQPFGSQKAIGPNMEWKRKPPNQNVTSSSVGVIDTSTGSTNASETNRSSVPLSNSINSDDAAGKLQEKLERLNVRSEQHLIIPDHLQVPEAACIGLSFGSFGTFVGNSLSMEFGKGGDDKSSSPLSEVSQKTEESNEEPSSRTSDQESESPTECIEQTSPRTVENLASGIDVRDSISQITVSQTEPSKQDPIVQLDPQFSLVETTPSYASVGFVPQIISSQYPSYEPALTSAHDASRQPSLVMQQTYDPSSSIYNPFLRPGGDGDARFSPFAGATVVSKYNGNAALLSGASVSASQETGTSVVVASAAPTAQGSQMAGIAPTTMSFPHQQMQLFPQPGGVHISPFPPTYIPYPAQYFPPIYISPPTLNSFTGNIGYPQPSSGSNYPMPSVTSFPSAAPAVKYSLSQYKPMPSGGNSSQPGFPVGYAGYTTSPSGFSASSATSGGNRAGFEENKEQNLYIPSQQVDGSAFWFRTPQNLPNMQSSSYYSLSAQGQNVAFAPAQSGHAAYAGLYHPAQSAVAQNSPQLLQQSDALGGAAGGSNSQAAGYQQSQPGQLNWSNY